MILATLTAEQRRLVDEYTEVRARVMAWRPQVNPDAARFSELEEILLGLAASQPAGSPVLLQGNTTAVPVSPRERKRKIIKIPALFKRLGTVWVAKHCKPTLKSLEKTLTPDELAIYVQESRTGPRSLGEPVAVDTQQKTAAA